MSIDDPGRANAETLPLPGLAEPSTAIAPPVRKKRRWVGWVVAASVLVVVIVVAWIVGDIVARSYATGYIREKLVSTFQLDPDQSMDITIGPGSLIAQAIGGSIDSVDVKMTDVTIGGLTGDVALAARAIPLDSAKPVRSLDIGLSVDETELQKLVGALDTGAVTKISLVKDTVAVESEFDLFGATIPLAVRLVPSVADGKLAFAPEAVSVSGKEISIEAIRDSPLGGVVGSLLGSQSLCVAEYLPKALTLSGISIDGNRLDLALKGNRVVLGGKDLSTFGTCG